MKNKVRQFLRDLQTYSKQTKFVQSRLPVIAENTEKDLKDFLTLITYFCCVSCSQNIDRDFDRNYNRKIHWVDSHHCGLFNQTLSTTPIEDIFEGFVSAFNIFLENRDRLEDLEVPLAEAFSCTTKSERTVSSKLVSTLKYFYINRRKNFIRHGLEELESKSYTNGQHFPPKGSMQKKSLSSDGEYFAVEIDRPPFINCFEHGSVYPWLYCGGVMAIEDFKKRNGKLVLADDREHFYASSQIEVNDWFFVYHLKLRHKRRVHFDPNLLKQSIIEMKFSGAGFIEMETLRNFFYVMDLLEQRQEAFEFLPSVTNLSFQS
jgi:hypothetical protein